MILYFLPFILLPAAGLLFWFRKKAGWTLATIYFSYEAAGAFLNFLVGFNSQSNGLPALEAIFPSSSPVVHLLTLLVFGGLTWTLCKDSMREIYQVNKRSMFKALGIGIGAILLIFIFFGI